MWFKAKRERINAKARLVKDAIRFVKNAYLWEEDGERIRADLQEKFGLSAEIVEDYDEDKEVYFVVITLDDELVKALKARSVRVERPKEGVRNQSSEKDDLDDLENDDSRWPSHF